MWVCGISFFRRLLVNIWHYYYHTQRCCENAAWFSCNMITMDQIKHSAPIKKIEQEQNSRQLTSKVFHRDTPTSLEVCKFDILSNRLELFRFLLLNQLSTRNPRQDVTTWTERKLLKLLWGPSHVFTLFFLLCLAMCRVAVCVGICFSYYFFPIGCVRSAIYRLF